MSELMEKIDNHLQAISLEVVTLEDQDIAAMGKILNYFGELEEAFKSFDNLVFLDLIKALMGYLERIIMFEAEDMTPLEDGIEKLQKLFRSLKNEDDVDDDVSGLLEALGFEKSDAVEEAEEIRTEAPPEAETNALIEVREEDREIMGDFVLESLDNLSTIEISLIDLEQDPGDVETINAIFRPFHTIKGVSSFLNLEKINKLAHSAENLLDHARNGAIQIDAGIIDIVLESVDMLKKMIQNVQGALESGSAIDDNVNTVDLTQRIEALNTRASGAEEKPLGEILVESGSVSPEDIEASLERQKEEPEKKIGEILVEQNKTDSKTVISGLREQKKFKHGQIDLQVKVDTKKLDNLVDLTGELVINQAMLKQNDTIVLASDQKLYHTMNQLTQITSSLQKTAMAMRMVPIKSTFQKMVRLVRDLAKNSGKEVALEMSGEDTEIDRNVVEELYEPMVHMIRNAADHGIESIEDRENVGKKKNGTINLRAYQRGSNIIIEIEDDGRGLNKDRILEKAKSKNLITDDMKLTDSEIYNMIFHAGFSTAKTVTDVSGRGVGMDVVKKAIEKLRGRVEIDSRPGQGSKFIISLPLTLAIIEGMLVRVGHNKYIIPTLAIRESFRPEKDQYSTIKQKGEMILSRGSLIPLIRLDQIFSVKGDAEKPWEGLVVTVENDGEQRCLLLDELLGKEEVVIKSIGQYMKSIKGIAGGAILGDGRVGLILDISGIFDIAKGSAVKPMEVEEEMIQ
ncbi:MAG: chemotaxis protein CheA [Deltaproteobacteria bacterium]|nr:chemotaxis protein CheA [Deltaproteobacteria bacterium]